MADVTELPKEPAPLPESVQRGLSASVRYLANNFLKEKHFSKVSASLANRWDKMQSIGAAVKLMEQHGVVLTPDEEQRISGMGEAQMIETLVQKMPQQSKEQFQHFFLQLQLIVSTATRVRQALEQGRADAVEQAMDDADSTGISQYILKMSIVQAGSEVTNLKKQHAAWVKDAESKLSRLVRGQEDLVLARKRLGKAQGELASFQANQNEAVKKVLMNFAGGSTTALLHACLNSWAQLTKRMKLENLIYEDYREAIEAAEKRLIEAKSEQLKGVRSMIERKNASAQGGLIAEVFGYWRDDILEAKQNAAMADEIAAMEARLKACADQNSANAKKVLARCGAASEMGMRDVCFQQWVQFHQEYAKNKELEDAVKVEEARIAAFKAKHSENAQGLLNSMSAATDTGLMHEVFVAWADFYKEEKRINEYAEVMNGAQAKMGAFGDRNKKGAKGVMERAHEHGITMLYLKIFGAWRLDTAVEMKIKRHMDRLDGKRTQLSEVRDMFKRFASQLDSNIHGGGMDSNRDLANGPPPNYRKKRAMSNAGSVSLPDIHARPGMDSGRPMSRDR